MIAMADQSPRRPKFYPTPGYIIDLGLSGGRRDLLDVIAGHDGFGANGRHCDAPQILLAREANLTKWTACKYLGEFVQAGVLIKHPHPTDGREASYEVSYEPSPEKVAQMRNYFARARKQEVAQTDRDSAEVVALENRQGVGIIENAPPNIFPKGKERKKSRRPPATESAAARDLPFQGAKSRGDSAAATEEKGS